MQRSDKKKNNSAKKNLASLNDSSHNNEKITTSKNTGAIPKVIHSPKEIPVVQLSDSVLQPNQTDNLTDASGATSLLFQPPKIQNMTEPSDTQTKSKSLDSNDINKLISALQQTIICNQQTVMNEFKCFKDNITDQVEAIRQNANRNQTREDNFSFSSPNFRGFPETSPLANPLTLPSIARHDQSCNIEKWKICYNGVGSVHDFIFKVETLKERSQCSWSHLLSFFHLLLEDKAKRWFWLFSKQRQNQNISYESFKESLIREFSHVENDHDKLVRMLERRQGQKEAFDDFFTALVTMNSRLKEPMGDKKLIELIKSNAKETLGFLLFAYDDID